MIRSFTPKRIFIATAFVALIVGAWIAFVPSAHVPPPEAKPVLRFIDVTDQAGIQFQHFNGAAGKKLLPETMGSGVAVIDFDRDGHSDIFFVNSCSWPGNAVPSGPRPTQALYRNRGDGTFEDVTERAGLAVELYGMGAAAGDYDNDGWPDLFVSAVGGNRLFHNIQGRRFEDVTTRAGVGDARWPKESAEAFSQHAEPIPFPSSSAWLDYDGDGRLDLFVCNYLTWSPAIDLGVMAVLPGGKRAYVPPQQFVGAQCELYRNVDGKRFENVSTTAGIHVSELDGMTRQSHPVGKSLGVVVCDADGDGWPDIAVANDTVRNFFFHNEPGPSGGRVFREIGLFAGLAYADGRPRGGMGIDAGEIAPETEAFIIANYTNEPNSLFQCRTRSPLQFMDVAADIGLASATRSPMKFGVLFADFDNDGRLDLYTANGHLEPDITLAQPSQSYRQLGQLFHNTGNRAELFTSVELSLSRMVGRGCAYLDYDSDGKLDLVVTDNNGRARLFHNESSTSNNWLRLSLMGGGGVNRDAVGATVTVQTGDLVQHRFVSATRGYLSQSEQVLTVGLGAATVADKVTVRWPGQTNVTGTWNHLATGKTHTLHHGAGN